MLRASLLRALAVIAVVPALVVATVGHARTYPGYPQIKVDRVDATDDGRLRLYVTYLDQTKKPVDTTRIESMSLEVQAKGRDRVHQLPFDGGKPRVKGNALAKAFAEPEPTLDVRTKTDLDLGLLVLAPAYLKSPLGAVLGDERQRFLSSLESDMMSGLAKLIRSKAKPDRANALLYADRGFLYLYVPQRGDTQKFVNFGLEEVRESCEAARKKAFEEDEAPEPTSGATLAELGFQACGLLSEANGAADALERASESATGGYHPYLWGIAPETLQSRTGEEPRSKYGFATSIDVGSAFSQAIRLLARAHPEPDQRALVIVSDGHDGYLRLYDDKIFVAKTACFAKHPEPVYERGQRPRYRERKKREAEVDARRQECLDQTILKFIENQNRDFADRSRSWLAMALASEIRIFAVGIRPDSERSNSFALERLKTLARVTGGTYREAGSPAALSDELKNLSLELSDQLIIEVNNPIEPELEATVRIRAKEEDGEEATGSAVRYVSPVRSHSGPFGWVTRVLDWFHDSIGKPWSWVVIGLIGLILLILVLWLGTKFIKLLIKGFKKLFLGGGAGGRSA